mmetsp:Transcript_19659/g.17847  ORF Transcript_19659/g.17847 Transcript_19659/m.17847 type:complete len:243 (+) Transcript_19659:59-787(+)
MDENPNISSDSVKITSKQFIRDRIVTPVSSRKTLLSFAHGVSPNNLFNKRLSFSYIDFEMLVKGVSVMLLDMMIFYQKISSKNQSDYDILPIEPEIYINLNCTKIAINSLDSKVNKLIEWKIIPSIQDIIKYLYYTKIQTAYIPPILIIASIYLKIICQLGNISLNINNYRLLFTVCLIKAQKLWDDSYKCTEIFAKLFPENYNEENLSQWESDIMKIIIYNTDISALSYEYMYTSLETLSY